VGKPIYPTMKIFKDIVQPNYVKPNALVYHQDRRVELNLLDDMYAGRKNLITKEQLHDFYLTRWRMFPYSNRSMHVELPPTPVFEEEQTSQSNCSKIGKPVYLTY
jgi:hypothetical protein